MSVFVPVVTVVVSLSVVERVTNVVGPDLSSVVVSVPIVSNTNVGVTVRVLVTAGAVTVVCRNEEHSARCSGLLHDSRTAAPHASCPQDGHTR